jgi:hypothetical protein
VFPFLSLSLSLSLSLWLYSPLDLGRFFSFLIQYTVGSTPWTGDQPVARQLPTHRTTQTQNERTQTSMPRVGFEPMTPVFERAKTVHASDRVATVIGMFHFNCFVWISRNMTVSIVLMTFSKKWWTVKVFYIA